MKKLITAFWLIQSTAYALNPVQGVYGGIFLGGSYSPPINLTFADLTTGTSTSGKLTYTVFGDIGGQIGYRYEPFRGELELLLNSNRYDKLTVGNYTIKSPTTSTGLRMKGQTNLGAILLNGYYDFYTPDSNSCVIPYVGLGIGYANVRNSVKFYYNNQVISGSEASLNSSTPAGQGILGLSYFLDDFTAFSLDYRYLTTKSIQPFNSRVQVSTLNLTFNGAFNFG